MNGWRRYACVAALVTVGINMLAAGCGDDTPESPSRYLLITADRLETIRQDVAAGVSSWNLLRSNVDEEMNTIDEYRTSPENIALVYLLTGEKKYAQAAYAWANEIMGTAEVRADSYLNFGDIMRRVAIVLNYCGAALHAVQRIKMEAYLDTWTHELWFENEGSGWGLNDPGNNYHMAFLEGTAFAGYALREVGNPNGQKYLDLLVDKIEKPGGVLDYLGTRARGGDWPEGTNYGQRAKQRLFSA
ncbi:MAG: hypothetical protein MUF54_08890, partial [Polyangiaceae bacterium]|nr:hypothetical protein [Polyangiaceae bacterium]